MIKLIASDLDGTLVPHEGAPSRRTVEAVRACEDAGYTVVFVTGRPPRWMNAEIGELTDHRGVAICANGALTLDLATESVLTSHLLPAAGAIRAAQVIASRVPDVAFAAETPGGFREAAGYHAPPSWAAYRDSAPTASLDDLVAESDGVVKLLATSLTASSDELLAIARDQLADVVSACHSTPPLAARGILEMAAVGVTKATTLAEFAAARGIMPGEVIAFGDMPNDAPMLRWAGTSFAMADGHPEALAAADGVAPAAAEDGVAQVLERLLAGDGVLHQAGDPAPDATAHRGTALRSLNDHGGINA